MNIKDFVKENKWIILIFLFSLFSGIIFTKSIAVKYWDETIYSNLGYDLSKNALDYSFDNGWSDFIPGGGKYGDKAGFRAPLLSYIIALFHLINIESLIDYIIPLFGALTVLALYYLSKLMYNKYVGLIAAMILSVTPMFAFFSGRLLADILSTFFILITLIFFWKGFYENKNSSKLLFGFFFALAILSKYSNLWFIPFFLLFLIYKNKSLNFVKDTHLYFSILIFFFTLSPWMIYGYNEYGNVFGPFLHGNEASSYWGGTQEIFFYFNNWILMFSFAGYFSLFALIYFIIKKDKNEKIFFVVLWIIVFLALASLTGHKEDRYIMQIAPALALISAIFIYNHAYYKRTIIFSLILIGLFSSAMHFIDVREKSYNTNSECFIQVSDYIKNVDGNFLIVSENPTIFRHYTKQYDSDYKYYPYPLTEENIINVQKNNRTYFVFSRLDSGLLTEEWIMLKEILKENYKLEFECSLDSERNFIYSNDF